jgi:hypothetical protein
VKYLLLSCSLFLSLVCTAQQPWRAKLIVYFEHADNRDSLIGDTIWVGCDSAGAAGYQPGLDVLASQVEPYHIYSVDDSLPGQYLKTNIKGFKKKEITEFKFKCNGKVRFIVWDSLEYSYGNDTMFMRYADLIAGSNVSFDISHQNSVGLSTYRYKTGFTGNYYNSDSIQVLEGGEALDFKLEIRFEDSTIFSGIKEHSLGTQIKIAQVSNETISVISDKALMAVISLCRINGEIVDRYNMNGTTCQVLVSDLPPGMYLLLVDAGNGTQAVSKFITH